ncbi:MAG: transposase, partial [Moraxellaceae bacterium]|nr:transposase [Moraxellaceae bacterium]
MIQALQNELKLLEGKNQALTLELAHLRRIRFGAKSEALSQPQLSLFEEDWQTDVSAIEAEIEQLPLAALQKPKRARAGCQPLPDHLPRIENRRILCVPPHPSAICLPGMRNRGRGTGAACGDRRQYGNTRTTCLDRRGQIPRSPAAVSHRTNRCPGRGHFIAFHVGGMGWTRRRGTATAGGPADLALTAGPRVTRRRECATKAQGENIPKQLCCTRDEGRPLGVAVQAGASNHLLLLRLRGV